MTATTTANSQLKPLTYTNDRKMKKMLLSGGCSGNTVNNINSNNDAILLVSAAVVLPKTTITQDIKEIKEKETLRHTIITNILGGWGVIQVLCILANAIKRVMPIAIEPLIKKNLTPIQIILCIIWCTYMIYTEGYKTFQLKFSPLVVKRAFGLSKNLSVVNCLLAGPYSMGLFGATRKRIIISWAVTIGVFGLVKAVKQLAYPWRSIVDAGVVLGLSYGVIAMCIQAVRAMFGIIPDIDECLPIKNNSATAAHGPPFGNNIKISASANNVRPSGNNNNNDKKKI